MVVISNRAIEFALVVGLYDDIDPHGIIIGYTRSSLILGYRFFFLFRREVWKAPLLSMNDIRPKMRFIMHVLSLALSQALSIYFYKLIIAPIAGFASLGLYQFGYQLLMCLLVIPESLYQYLLS